MPRGAIFVLRALFEQFKCVKVTKKESKTEYLVWTDDGVKAQVTQA